MSRRPGKYYCRSIRSLSLEMRKIILKKITLWWNALLINAVIIFANYERFVNSRVRDLAKHLLSLEYLMRCNRSVIVFPIIKPGICKIFLLFLPFKKRSRINHSLSKIKFLTLKVFLY